MPTTPSPRLLFLTLAGLAAAAIGCGGKTPDDVGQAKLAPCPGTPNCVSSLDPPGTPSYVEPLWVVGSTEDAWVAVGEVLAAWSRVEVVALTDDALHAESTSLMLRFVDDLELRLHRHDARIDVRSASRLGRSDLGVNRRRVERLREALVERGVVASSPPILGEEP